MKETFRREAPAKINLALDILGKRPDGYHALCSIMQTVSLCDSVELAEGGEGFTLSMAGFTPPEGRKTLEQRAAEAFFARLGRVMPPLTVRITKRTPAYAGLGGGSADVAALLHILRDRYAPKMEDAALEAIGAEVGSDMPFCLRGGTALAEGRGEILTDLPPLPDCWIVLCKPPFPIPTPMLFARADSVAIRHRPDIPGMRRALENGDLEGVAGRLGNVFEEVLPPECGAVFAIRDALLAAGALGAGMSGSGPTVFGIFREEGLARAAQEKTLLLGESYAVGPLGKLT